MAYIEYIDGNNLLSRGPVDIDTIHKFLEDSYNNNGERHVKIIPGQVDQSDSIDDIHDEFAGDEVYIVPDPDTLSIIVTAEEGRAEYEKNFRDDDQGTGSQIRSAIEYAVGLVST